MNIRDIEKIARLAMELDIRPEALRRIEQKQMESVGRTEKIPYYNFLFLLARLTDAFKMVELGTLHGGAAAHLAWGGSEGSWLLTIDTNPDAGQWMYGNFNCAGIIKRTGDSLNPNNGILDHLKQMKENNAALADIIFFDTEHTYDHTKKEFNAYRPYMSKDGIMIFDDTKISPEMERFWSEVPEPKIELNFLHSESGFGVHLVE
jgi:predicted O-methyltransferase YrrM